MAESNRRGRRGADEQPDDGVPADAVDDAAFDANDLGDDLDDDFDDDRADDLETVPSGARSRGRGSDAVARRARDSNDAKRTAGGKSVMTDRAVKIGVENPGLGSRIVRFIREVVAELRKVNWPSRKELLTYTSVVIVFVVIMMTIVGLLDQAFLWVVGHVFA